MKRINSRFCILISITIVYGFCLGLLIKRVSYRNNISDLVAYICTIVAIIVCIIAFLKMIKKRYVYVSYTKTKSTHSAFEKLKVIYHKRILVTVSDGLEPGDSLTDSMMMKIHESNFCLVLIDKELSPFQKKEIKEMKRQNKRIIPILVSKDAKIPTILSNISFLTLE